jgi:hypothetical protein
MSSRVSKIAWFAAATVAFAPLAAEAHVYSLDFTGSPNDVIAQITTSDTQSVPGGYDILKITGTVTGTNGGSISGLISNPNQPNVSFFSAPGGAWSYDNVFFTPGTPHLDNAGVLFEAAGFVYNLYTTSPTSYFLSSNNPLGHYTDFNPGPSGPVVITSVPEPSVWAMLLLGFGGLGFVAWRGTRRDHAFATT